MSVIQVHGRDIEWVACKEHAQYQDSGYIVLTCKKCVVRPHWMSGDAHAAAIREVQGELWERLAEVGTVGGEEL